MGIKCTVQAMANPSLLDQVHIMCQITLLNKIRKLAKLKLDSKSFWEEHKIETTKLNFWKQEMKDIIWQEILSNMSHKWIEIIKIFRFIKMIEIKKIFKSKLIKVQDQFFNKVMSGKFKKRSNS